MGSPSVPSYVTVETCLSVEARFLGGLRCGLQMYAASTVESRICCGVEFCMVLMALLHHPLA